VTAAAPDFLPRMIAEKGRHIIGGVPEGYRALVISDLARFHGDRCVYVARDAGALASLSRALGFFAPDLPIVEFPAWDCLPYDRLSPQPMASATRMATLARLPALAGSAHIVLTTVSAMMQYVPPRELIGERVFQARPGQDLDMQGLVEFLSANGYSRCSTVMEPGDFAVRGGIIDLFPPGNASPVRLDMFGQTLESIRSFDPETQRSKEQCDEIFLFPAGEIHLNDEAVSRFRRGYTATFGAVTERDPLYEAISAGARYQGMEHWLPLFYEKLDTAFDHFGAGVYFTDPQTANAYQERAEQIRDYYTAREEAMHDKLGQGGTIKPLPPEHLYLTDEVWQATLDGVTWVTLDGYARPDAESEDFGARMGKNFAAERGMDGVNVFDSFIAHLSALQNANKKVLLVCWSAGARDRMTTVLEEHGARDIRQVASWADVAALPAGVSAIADFGLDEGFETDTLAVVSEQDILGDRMVRRQRRKRADNFLTEAASLSVGDHVVHVEHGIGRFEGLQTIDVDGAPHDCLKLVYHGDSRLFLPVENIELLSRFGGDDMSVTLDKIGGGAWQMRKAKLKQKLNIIAEELIKTAAARAMREGEKLFVGDNLYEEFCARFAFEETEDQLSAIEAVVDDLASGKPMDRLVCGDVGFGKTEVALRAAFIAAISGKQVAIIAPTTLLARQHLQTFSERFKDLPVVVRELSRLVSAKDGANTRAGLAEGEVDIIIGTHALLSKNISFKRLGLVVVDEEQHFGVAHKERLKNLRNEVHVLTLTATPIPRTLQMAMTGVRDLSIIATPPVDRLAVRTYVSPFDRVILREALLREKYRAGQSFIIVPRISDIKEITDFLSTDVPEVRFITAHGQMSGGDLEERMTAFYGGTYDILVSTSIIESGLDIPSVNTIIIHRADMFGLAQLYQMRGRVGRSKSRAYAYLTYHETNGLTEAAEKRLKVMQSLDSLGAGFNLASYDLDLRGAGNLVGEEQSGHIKEVGFELYQTMLEEAVANQQGVETDRSWSPQINAGISVMIPEAYVPALDLRMGLYRRLADLEDRSAIDAFAVELVDRFGALPPEVKHLLDILVIKGDCLRAGVEKIDAGPKGAAVFFRDRTFKNVDGLLNYVAQNQDQVRLRPDQSLVFRMKNEDAETRLAHVRQVSRKLAEIAQAS